MISNQSTSSHSRLRAWDFILLYASLIAIVVLAWIYLLKLSQEMATMDMSTIPVMRSWTPEDYLLMFFMWVVMMVGMMVPTAIRAVVIYSKVAIKANQSETPVAAVYWFILGYILVWTGFSFLAVIVQAGLAKLGMLSPMMISSSASLGAALLITAGLYQFSPLKDTCLKHCQSPALFLAGKFGPRFFDGIKVGMHHGIYCLGCCWVIMTLLFVGGVMNLLWIAVITTFVFLEKLLPPKFRLRSIGAILMIIAGVLYFLLV